MKRMWLLSYVVLWFILIIFFFSLGHSGVQETPFYRASTVFVSGLALLVAIQSFSILRRKLRDGKSRLVYVVIGATVIPVTIGIFVCGIYLLGFSYWYQAHF